MPPLRLLLADDHCLFRQGLRRVCEAAGGLTYTCANLALLGVGNLCADPRFVRPAWGEAGDYHLQPGSPALGAGTADDAPSVDLEGHPRSAPRALALANPAFLTLALGIAGFPSLFLRAFLTPAAPNLAHVIFFLLCSRWLDKPM